MYVALITVLITVVAVEFIFGKKVKSNKVHSLGTFTFFIGLSLYFVVYFFDVPLIAMRYGVKPVVIEPEKGEMATLLMSAIGIILIIISSTYEYFLKNR